MLFEAVVVAIKLTRVHSTECLGASVHICSCLLWSGPADFLELEMSTVRKLHLKAYGVESTPSVQCFPLIGFDWSVCPARVLFKRH